MSNNRTGRSGHRRRAPFKEDPLDFDPRKQLRDALRGRPVMKGFTFDSNKTYLRDDGLVSIKQTDEGWEVTSAITDVPAMLPADSHARKVAAQRMDETHIKGKGIRRIFPVDFLEDFVGFGQGLIRAAITFRIKLGPDFSVKGYDIGRSAFHTMQEFSDEKLVVAPEFNTARLQDAKHVSRSLYRERMNHFIDHYDSQFGDDVPSLFHRKIKDCAGMKEGELLVHEVTRLTNRVATDFFHTNNLTVPYYPQRSAIDVGFVSDDFDFDHSCNQLCINLINKIEGDKLPTVHLTSPMRHYKDFLALQVLGNHLAGKPEDQKIKEEVLNLTKAFNKHSCVREGHMLHGNWKHEWSGILAEQKSWHPFKDLSRDQSCRSPATQLKLLCEENRHAYPHLAHRILRIRGRDLHFVGLDLTTVMKTPADKCRSWAVANTPEEAMECASYRMLKSMGQAMDIPSVTRKNTPRTLAV
ncbi:MAG: RNB domain-containing ribonuclease [Micavibrio sp.]